MNKNNVGETNFNSSPLGRLGGVCVFCSSSDKIADEYKQMAFRLGEFIAENGSTLVYGGATGGLMTSVAEGAKSKSGEIIGVISDPIVKMNRQSDVPTTRIVVKNLSERKQKMKEISDVFVVLPGGCGTVDEMFDVIAAGTVGEHRIPLILLNQHHFFNHLIEQIKFFKKEKSIPEQESYRPIIVNNLDECEQLLLKMKFK